MTYVSVNMSSSIRERVVFSSRQALPDRADFLASVSKNGRLYEPRVWRRILDALPKVGRRNWQAAQVVLNPKQPSIGPQPMAGQHEMNDENVVQSLGRASLRINSEEADVAHSSL